MAKASKPRCLFWTVVFLTLAGASGWFVYRRAASGSEAFFGGFAGGIILLIVFSWLSAIPARIAEWLLILRTRLGGEPRDGKRAAIIGTLRSHGELETPFTKKRCVLYTYEVTFTERAGSETRMVKAYDGFGMVPLSVEHDVERTRILAKPAVPRMKKEEPKTPAELAAARHYIEHTTFTPGADAAIDEDDLSRTDGRLRYDYRRKHVDDLAECSFMERRFEGDVPVCVLGEYHADRHALLGPVTLRTGRNFAIEAAWRVVNAGIALAFAVFIAVVAAAFFCASYPLDAVEQSHPQWNLQWWEIDLERFVARNVRPRLTNAGMLTPPGYHLQDVCEGCAKGRLEIDGRVIELKHAAYQGARTVHLSSGPGARDGVTFLDKDRITLTVNGKTATVPPSWLQPGDVETSLDEHGEFAGRITVIAPDRSIRGRVTFKARVDARAWLPGRP